MSYAIKFLISMFLVFTFKAGEATPAFIQGVNEIENINVTQNQNKYYIIVNFELKEGQNWVYEPHIKIKSNEKEYHIYDLNPLLNSAAIKKEDITYGEINVFTKNFSVYIPKAKIKEKFENDNIKLEWIACDIINGVCFPPKNIKILY